MPKLTGKELGGAVAREVMGHKELNLYHFEPKDQQVFIQELKALQKKKDHPWAQDVILVVDREPGQVPPRSYFAG